MEKTPGRIIKERREQLHISQRQLAQECNLSNSSVSRIESDMIEYPDHESLRAIANCLRIDYNFLLSQYGIIEDDPEIRVIQRAAKKMTQDDKENLLKIAKNRFPVKFLFTENDYLD